MDLGVGPFDAEARRSVLPETGCCADTAEENNTPATIPQETSKREKEIIMRSPFVLTIYLLR